MREERAVNRERHATAAAGRRILKVIQLARCACGRKAKALIGTSYYCDACKPRLGVTQ